jgi:hypothetical protein
MDVAVRAVLSGWNEAQREIDDTAKSLDRLKDTSSRGAAAANDDISKLTGSLSTFARVGGLAVGAAIAVAAAATINAVNNTRQYGEELHRLSDKTGKTVEELSSFKLIAEATGTTIEKVAEGWVTGSAAMAKLQEEAKKAGIVMSEDTARAADELNTNLAVLKAYGEGFFQEVASPIVEGLAKITTAMRDAKREGAGLVGVLLAGFRTTFTGDDQHKLNVDIVEQTNALLRAQNELDRLRQKGAMSSVIERQQAKVDALRGVLNTQVDVQGSGLMATPHDELHVESEQERRARTKAEREEEARQKALEREREALKKLQVREDTEYLLAQQAKLDARDEMERKAKLKQINENRELEDRSIRDDLLAQERALQARDKITREARLHEIQEEKRVLASIFGSGEFGGLAVLGGTHRGLSGEIEQTLRGNQGLGSLAKNAGQVLVDEMVREVSRNISRELLKPFKGAFEKIGEVFGGTIKDIFGGVFEWLKGGFGGFMDWLGGLDWGSTFSGLSSSLSSVFGSLGFAGAGVGVGAGIVDIMNHPEENLASFLSSGITGFGGLIDDIFPTGTSGSVYTSPSLIMVGDAGPEMVSVSPLGGAAHGRGGSGGNIIVQGPVIMDPYTQKRFARMMGRL